ncbi:MAG: peptidylprolyl isomerase [Oscillospiraceae bacterium]|nr:peptidylprolyl isomerase [Oscillospiraceae bacterium]
MNCKHCNAELEEGVNFCPACGAAQTEPEAPVVEETPIVEETPAVAEAPAKTGLGAGKIALLVVLAVAAVAVIAALILGGKGGTTPAETTLPTAPSLSGESTPAETVPMTVPADGNPEDVTCKGTYSTEMDAFNGETVVATMGDAKLTNTDLQVYYWMQVYDFLNQYGSYASMFGMDPSKPLDVQLSLEGTMTWQQYFLDAALDTWTNYQAMCHEANAAGFQLEEEYSIYLEDLPESLALNAEQMGYGSAEEMIQRDMGPGATVEGYLNYLSNYYLGYMYYGDTLEQMPITDADVEAYFDAHAEEYRENGLEKTDERYVDVRHILISPESAEGATTYTDAEWAAAEKKANDILNEWLTKNPTEDGFAVLAEAHSTDPGSASNGGLYEGVYKGQMVAPFENWCFDASRKTGDYGIVKTDYGYHIMYYVGSELVWYLTAEQDMMVEKGNEFLQSILEKHPAQIDYAAIQIGEVSLIAE